MCFNAVKDKKSRRKSVNRASTSSENLILFRLPLLP